MKKFLLFFLLYCTVSISQTIDNIDSLNSIISNPGNDSILCSTIYQKGKIIKKSNPSMALELFKECLHLSEDNGYQKLEVMSLNHLGVLCYHIGASDQACTYYKEVIKRTHNYNNHYDINCNSLINLGLIYYNNKEYEEAYLCYQKVIQQVNEKNMTTFKLNTVYHNIAYNHIRQRDYDSALFYFDKTSNIEHHTLLKIVNLDTISAIKRKNYYAYTLAGVGLVYQKRKQFDMALDFLSAALKLRNDVGYKTEIAKAHNELGTLLREKGEDLLALKHFRESDANANKVLLNKEIKISAINQYEIYKSRNMYDSALKFHEIYSQSVEKIKQKETEHALIEFSFLNNLEKIELEYENKELTNKIIRNEEKIREKFFRYILLGILVLIIGFLLFLYNRYRLIRKQRNIINEKKIEIETAYSDLNKEKLKVEKKNKVITDSINYAKRIQDALLPEDEVLQSFFKDFFAFYLPKDIVGGDFYWYRCFDNLAFIATVDCTGHGVPGGFMSMMGSLLLDKIVKSDQLDTSKILEELNKEIIKVLKQNSGGEIQDGMDISLCLVDKKNKEIHFSGARNGIVVIQNGKSIRLQADLLPVGGYYSSKSKKLKRTFETQAICLNNADWVFMYSDGFHDQLGGDQLTSLGMSQFENMLIELTSEPNNASEKLQKYFDNWKGNMIQLDDVLVLGFQL
jgi:serine phosphatase RsbU (regulator of sigma subunit)